MAQTWLPKGAKPEKGRQSLLESVGQELNSTGGFMRLRTLAFVLLAVSGLVAQDQPKPTVKQCRANLKLWFQELNEHAASVNDWKTQQFSTVAGQTSTYDWLARQNELADCSMTVDRPWREEYAKASARIDSLINLRYIAFLLGEGQMKKFGGWEREQQQESKSAPAPDTDGPTVAANR